jgi:hypothetical protein
MLIPVPLLGAVIGGVIGGIVAYTSTHGEAPLLERSEFLSSCNALENSQREDGQWVCCLQNLQILGVTEAMLSKKIPMQLHNQFSASNLCSDVWMTLVCLATLSLYHALQDEKTRLVAH